MSPDKPKPKIIPGAALAPGQDFPEIDPSKFFQPEYDLSQLPPATGHVGSVATAAAGHPEPNQLPAVYAEHKTRNRAPFFLKKRNLIIAVAVLLLGGIIIFSRVQKDPAAPVETASTAATKNAFDAIFKNGASAGDQGQGNVAAAPTPSPTPGVNIDPPTASPTPPPGRSPSPSSPNPSPSPSPSPSQFCYW